MRGRVANLDGSVIVGQGDHGVLQGGEDTSLHVDSPHGVGSGRAHMCDLTVDVGEPDGEGFEGGGELSTSCGSLSSGHCSVHDLHTGQLFDVGGGVLVGVLGGAVTGYFLYVNI